MKVEMVLICGASGHGKVIIDIVEKEGKYKIAGLIDDNPEIQGRDFCAYPVIGGFDVLKEDDRDAQGNLLPDKERLPSFGRFLRNTSLDELPELFNVLWGDMNLVGSCPLLME